MRVAILTGDDEGISMITMFDDGVIVVVERVNIQSSSWKHSTKATTSAKNMYDRY